MLRAEIVRLAREYGRYGYRRITALLRWEGWQVNHKRVERIWREEGLKVPHKQPKRGRLWLGDGCCVRLRQTHFTLQVEGTSQIFITGPAVVKEVTGEDVSFEELGGAKVHSEISGVSHLMVRGDQECLALIRRLLTYLPQNNREFSPIVETDDDFQRLCENLTRIVPTDPKKTYDVRDVIREVVDSRDLLEILPRCARNMITGFARLAGRSVGVVGNQPKFLAGAIDVDAAGKGSRFVRFCDAFNIPLIIFVDVPGYMPGVRQEYGGIIRHGTKMLYAWSEATVPSHLRCWQSVRGRGFGRG